jgi:hypothetical protein
LKNEDGVVDIALAEYSAFPLFDVARSPGSVDVVEGD